MEKIMIKKRHGRKDETITLRIKKEDKNVIRQKALLYSNGVLSDFITHAALNYHVKEDDLKGPE